jgi:hypothetical protein
MLGTVLTWFAPFRLEQLSFSLCSAGATLSLDTQILLFNFIRFGLQPPYWSILERTGCEAEMAELYEELRDVGDADRTALISGMCRLLLMMPQTCELWIRPVSRLVSRLVLRP